jgi:heptosyltransferase III
VISQVKAERGRVFLRKLDYWFGVPLLGLASIFRSKKAKPEHFQSIGICIFAAIGDALLASALIADIKKAYPDSKITIFATKANSGIFSLISGFDELVAVPITSPLAALKCMRAHPVDVLIDSSQWPRIGALLAAISRAKYTIGFKTEGQSRHFAYDCCVEHSPKQHELDNFRALLTPLGISPNSMPPINLSKLNGVNCSNIKHPYVVLHPWASGTHFELREWPIESWLELSKRLLGSGYGVVISGGPGDIDRTNTLISLIQKLEHAAPENLLSLAGKADLLTTAAYLNGAAGVVSVNTGTMHLAALLGRPLAALHGPTNPDRWGPIYPDGKNEQNSLILGPGAKEGGAYLNLGFEYPNNLTYLMDQISVDAVVAALNKLSLNIQ